MARILYLIHIVHRFFFFPSVVQQTETPYEKTHKDEQEHVTVARALQKYLIKARLARIPFPIKFPTLNPRPSSTQQSPTTSSKILPLICPKTAQQRSRPNPAGPTFQKNVHTMNQPMTNENLASLLDNLNLRKFPAAGAPPYIPVRHCNPHSRIAPPVTIRNTIPVFSAPPLPSPQPSLVMRPPTMGMAPPVSIRQAVPVFAAAPVRMEHPSIKVEDPRISRPTTPRVENPSLSRDVPFSKLPPVLTEDPLGYKKPVPVAPNSEAQTAQVDLPRTEVLTVEPQLPKICRPPVSTKSSAEETTAEKDEVQEPAEVEGSKDMKI